MTDSSGGGVSILLIRGVRLRFWIRCQDLYVSEGRAQLGNRQVRIIKIRGGEASFMPGGGVDVCMPGSSQYIAAFKPGEVLQIRGFDGYGLMRSNYELCLDCGTNTCKVTSSEPSTQYAGKSDAILTCGTCGKEHSRVI